MSAAGLWLSAFYVPYSFQFRGLLWQYTIPKQISPFGAVSLHSKAASLLCRGNLVRLKSLCTHEEVTKLVAFRLPCRRDTSLASFCLLGNFPRPRRAPPVSQQEVRDGAVLSERNLSLARPQKASPASS